jgi:putative PIN family toxin of toxin-antitoxin system
MRITCDTNVLVRAAVRPAGPARAVLIEGTAEQHLLILSEIVLAEVARVLRYERVRQQANLTEQDIENFVDALRDSGELVALPDVIPKVCSDETDDVILATAVAGQADVICTRDRHLRHRLVQAYCATYGIRVLTDLELLAEFRAQVKADEPTENSGDEPAGDE